MPTLRHRSRLCLTCIRVWIPAIQSGQYHDNDEPGSFRTSQVYYEIPDADHAGLLHLSLKVSTDATGAYTVQGLLPGMDRVCAETRPITAYQAGCYGGPLLVNTPAMGKDVPVRAGAETTGIDIFVGRTLPEHNYLPSIAR